MGCFIIPKIPISMVGNSMGVSGGSPKRWMISWEIGKPIYEWMMTGGTPISGNLHIKISSIDMG